MVYLWFINDLFLYGQNINLVMVGYNMSGCKQIIIVDGGGSITLLYKKNNNVINKSWIVSDRYMADMLYFVEQ